MQKLQSINYHSNKSYNIKINRRALRINQPNLFEILQLFQAIKANRGIVNSIFNKH